MLLRSPDTDAFWEAFHHGLGLDPTVISSISSDHSAIPQKWATELADLVMAGIKRATATLARDYNEDR